MGQRYTAGNEKCLEMLVLTFLTSLIIIVRGTTEFHNQPATFVNDELLLRGACSPCLSIKAC